MSKHKRQWLVFLGRHPSLWGLDVVFVPERCRVERVELRHLTSSGSSTAEVEGGIAIAEFPPIKAGKGYVGLLEVTYSEDAPLIAAIAVESQDPAKAPLAFALPIDPFVQGGLVPPPSTRQPSKAPSDDLLLYLWQVVLANVLIPVSVIRRDDRRAFLDPYLGRLADTYALRVTTMESEERMRRFFLALDFGTLSKAVPPEWRAIMASVNTRLGTRVHVRSFLGQSDLVPVWQKSPRFAEQLQEASMFVHTLMVTHLYDTPNGDIVDWAFTRFAVERLAITHPEPIENGVLQSHGAPDGVAFFRFAELALACIENGVHVKFWMQHLPILVGTAHLYGEHGGELNAESKYVYAYRENRRFPLGRLPAVKKQYAVPRVKPREFFEDRFTSMLSQALTANVATPVQTRPLPHNHRADFERQDTHARGFAGDALEFFASTGLFELLQKL